MSSYERSSRDSSTFGLFVLGAVFGAAVAYLTSRKAGPEGLHIDHWLKDHGINGQHMLDRVKKLLHVRKNGHGFTGGNGHQTVRKHS